MRDAGISVILISQGSSEHSICFAIPEAQAVRAEEAVRRAFDAELRDGQIQHVEVGLGMSILAVVGDGMAGAHGVAAKVFNSLGDAAISVRAIAQGASERNISVVVDGKGAAKALRAVHAAFYLSPNTLSIGLIGPGTVGRVLLGADRDADRAPARVESGFAGARRSPARSACCWTRPPSISTIGRSAWPKPESRWIWKNSPTTCRRTTYRTPSSIDCTASADVAEQLCRDWLTRGIHIVTPNKKANSGALPYYRALQEAARAAGTHYLYEATVGAGLPIIQTLRDLRGTGDEITRIEGIFSGTLAYLFNVFDGSESFSSIVRAAKAKGYTEPDPRDDLSGMDVARKLIILGREMGLTLEMSDVRGGRAGAGGARTNAASRNSWRVFRNSMPRWRQRWRRRAARARSCATSGRIDAAGKATVGLMHLDAKHAFANIALTDNVVRFATRRYCDNPLIVQGPGAGPEVTAGGVFSDLLRLSAYLGAHLSNEDRVLTDVTAFAPATVANVGIGFDILGHTVEAVGDRVRLRRIDESVVRIRSISGIAGELPVDPAQQHRRPRGPGHARGARVGFWFRDGYR